MLVVYIALAILGVIALGEGLAIANLREQVERFERGMAETEHANREKMNSLFDWIDKINKLQISQGRNIDFVAKQISKVRSEWNVKDAQLKNMLYVKPRGKHAKYESVPFANTEEAKLNRIDDTQVLNIPGDEQYIGEDGVYRGPF